MTTTSDVFGLHAVRALLESQPERILHLQVTSGRNDQKIMALLALAKAQNVPVAYVTSEQLDRLTGAANHQGIVAQCKKMRTYTEADLATLLASIQGTPLLLILDGVQDPHNLGACFRSADAAGVHLIIAPKDKSVGITPIVSKVASGATEKIPFVQVTNLARAISLLKEQGVWIYGAAGEAKQTLYQADLRGPVGLVMGAEGTGLRQLTRERCDFLLKIPMLGSVSSLNVSVATGVFLFEVLRQRMSA